MTTRPTILAVDDSPDVLAMISGLLNDSYKVKLSNSGEKALEIVTSTPPDLILLDIMMGGIDGYEVCEQLKMNPETREIPVIFLTAKCECEDEIKGFELGAVDYITKPISPSKLLARVKTHLTLKAASDFLKDKNDYLEQRVAERTMELQEVNARLIQSQKMEAIGQLAGGLAHDFNNVLSIIKGFGFVLEEQMEPDNPHLEFVKKILSASDRANDLTQSMLNFSRTQIMKPQKQNLNWIVSKVCSFVEKIIGAKIQFKRLVNVVSLPVFVDGGQIEQVLINLFNNARDAMSDGGDLTVSTELVSIDTPFSSAIDSGEPGRYALITVSDTGIGMDETTRCKIFESFFTTKEAGKGTGLGLAMVHAIIKQHNGFVDVASEPRRGASFKIYLPIVETNLDMFGSDVAASGS